MYPNHDTATRDSSESKKTDLTSTASPRADLLEAIAMLEKIVEDRGLMTMLSQDERKRLVIAAGQVAKPDRFALKKMSKEFRRQEKQRTRTADMIAKSATQVRLARSGSVYTIPDKIAFTTTNCNDVLKETTLHTPKILHTPHRCYICKASYRELHFFYDAMCSECAAFNYQKRFQTADCRGRIALVTGARVKIGYQAALMLLRAGATVIVTTRFPHDATQRYYQEKDFAEWRDRIHIYGLDLRHAPSVEVFAQHIQTRFSSLDFLLNNAAQTVRKPRGFYRHLLDTESVVPTEPERAQILSGFMEYRRALSEALGKSPALTPEATAGTGLISYGSGRFVDNDKNPSLHLSAAMSQIPLMPEDLTCGAEVFPEGHFDIDLQQVDLRNLNSWRLRLSDVSTAELLEIQLINAVAPFILCSKLKPLMLRSNTHDKHIVNVSAMEGKFTRFTKTDKHPHTNMAKAALNMMTQTSAPDYVRDGIHMNAVDTGWVTDEDPWVHASRKRSELGFEPPLDIIDGAARICDPIFSGLNTGEHIWGKFLKDYKTTAW